MSHDAYGGMLCPAGIDWSEVCNALGCHRDTPKLDLGILHRMRWQCLVLLLVGTERMVLDGHLLEHLATVTHAGCSTMLQPTQTFVYILV